MKNEPAQNLEMKDLSLAVGTMPLIRCGPSALPAGGLSSGYINFEPAGRNHVSAAKHSGTSTPA
jgi:hypothetical protein